MESFIWGCFMDHYDTQQQGERNKKLQDALEKLSEQFPQFLRSHTDEKPQSTEACPTQLELPLGWIAHDTQERLLKVSEPCTNPTQFQLSTKKK
jgi:hypothetical protein